mmetsp:Transcript_40607/g.98073  ORF Transcript_40607/g.98073 Transcript_40607/m.98073 type:complete len:346 (+) Transcript_40607:344-1381(+)|eukprot:CAMPEP_0113640136 /NCGR_PEP_ID=MMETSP0017_2-20120614/21061_1 /TAXON_ID=2856 /ORGANISM="Cylindrotheca closterium" /LENGTH=345 /DNA_ID=CAMNT_0000551395 /DNA_START=88 /DNA_END=1125 /DNA_ORIENTATION=+ /assembly_acc=CAM_ASM_000147
MKINSQLTGLFLTSLAIGTNAFTSIAPKTGSSFVLKASERQDPGPPPLGTQMPMADQPAPPGPAGPLSKPPNMVDDLDSSELVAMDMFPIYPSLETIQGGGTVRTYKMPLWADKCQMLFTTDGRPMKAEANLWLGPIRVVHTIKIDMEDGARTPYQSTITFKKFGQVLKVSTSDSLEFPVLAGVYVPNPERAKDLHKNTIEVFDNATPQEKKRIQGGSTLGGGGAVRYWTVPPNVQSVQVIGWSKDVGKKSFKLKVEVLQGPNNIKQGFFLQCGGSTQPYHGVLQTPGPGSIIRITNQKFLEDGLIQIAIVPYEVTGEVPVDIPSVEDLGSKFPTSRINSWWDNK